LISIQSHRAILLTLRWRTVAAARHMAWRCIWFCLCLGLCRCIIGLSQVFTSACVRLSFSVVLSSPSLPLSFSGRVKWAKNGGGNRGKDRNAQKGIAQMGARAQHEDALLGAGEEGDAREGRQETAGGRRPASGRKGAREGKARGWKSNSGGTAPAVGQGKRVIPANLWAGLFWGKSISI
jgi:hypothetical protein